MTSAQISAALSNSACCMRARTSSTEGGAAQDIAAALPPPNRAKHPTRVPKKNIDRTRIESLTFAWPEDKEEPNGFESSELDFECSESNAQVLEGARIYGQSTPYVSSSGGAVCMPQRDDSVSELASAVVGGSTPPLN